MKAKAAILFLGLLGIHFGLWVANDKFMIGQIRGPLEGVGEVVEQSIVEQEFRYLGKGSQAFAFVSVDGAYVLKFFRENRLGRKGRRERVRASVGLAAAEMRAETGLVAVHLGETPGWNPRVLVVDRLGRRYRVELGRVPFVVQRRGVLVREAVAEWMEGGQEVEAKRALSALVELMRERERRGIADRDTYLTKNAGFCGERPFFIDVGQFERGEGEPLPKSFAKLEKWLDGRYPALKDHLDSEIALPN